MLKRKINDSLLAWKQSTNKKCIIIEGARQVGKTYSITKFANDHYLVENTVIINFLENMEAHKIFSGDLDAKTIKEGIKILFRDKVLKANETILFLDEIQACPNAIAALKFLSIEGSMDVIASGSLLGIAYSAVSSFPVGYVDRLTMNSLDLEEFLWALDVEDKIVKQVKDCFDNATQVPEIIHSQMMKLFTQYVVVGGMPEVVNAYKSNHDFNQVLKIQQAIVNDYKDDIAKYANRSDKVKARECFESIPRQLAKDYKKFQYKVVSSNGRSTTYGSSIQWLIDAGIINKCHNLTIPNLPLVAYIRVDSFKIYLRDTGLLLGMLGVETQTSVLQGDLGTYNGGIYENIISDMLFKAGKELMYFERRSQLEVDFIIPFKGHIAAVEVKSADNTKSKSLDNLLNEKAVQYGIKLSSKNVSQNGSIYGYPLYMAMFL